MAVSQPTAHPKLLANLLVIRFTALRMPFDSRTLNKRRQTTAFCQANNSSSFSNPTIETATTAIDFNFESNRASAS